jgi:predicted Holliday junction resolvase-like endonuclease
MTNDIQVLIIVLAALAVLLLFALIASLSQSRQRALVRFEQWRTNELQRFEQWKTNELQLAKQELNRALAAEYEVKMLQWRGAHEANIRADAIIRSSAVIRGRVSEHLAPYIHFPYNPRDARFIGSPIDIIVFNGLEDGAVREIVFLEVKTGEGASLSPKQRQIRDAIQDKNVIWCEFRV